MKTSIKIITSLISLILLIFILYLINAKDPKTFFWLKQLMPVEFKKVLKNTIFIVPELKKQIKIDKENYHRIKKENENISDELVKIQQAKNLVNQRIFPDTQFVTLFFKEIKILSNASKEIDYLKNINVKDNQRDGKKTTPFYIENIGEKVLVTTFNGETVEYNNFNFISEKFENNKYIKNNLPKDITVLDTLYFNNNLFVSYIDRIKGCDHLKIVKAKFNNANLIFSKFYEQGEKNLNAERCGSAALGGRLEVINKLKDPSLIVSTNDTEKIDLYETLKDQFNQNLLKKVMHILKIELSSKKVSELSNGHRNPQGLLVNDNNIILSTEHGPRGGDEINKIIAGKNYGWPLASYGENYNDNYQENDEFKFLKNHEDFDFQEPIYSFVPSIGISQIIQVPENFSTRWKNNYLVTSLKKNSMFRINFDKKFSKIITMEEINIGKRIRDISYNESGNYFTIALENEPPSIGIIKAKKN